jgi:predicted ATPase
MAILSSFSSLIMIMKKNYKKNLPSLLDGPFLDAVRVTDSPLIDWTSYPFSLDIIKNIQEIHFPTQVTFFIGENGTGKSTILEAIACKAGFGFEGGSKHISFKTSSDKVYSAAQKLADEFILSWRQKPKDGYFFRAESFYNVANYLDYLGQAAYVSYGGKSLHEQSHGESFLSFFKHRLNEGGFFILDEPEAALSPQRQLALLVIMKQLCKHTNTQFIIATHSPILLAYPNATIYSCDEGSLHTVAYKDTEHYQITKRFLDNPEQYMQHLFSEESD